MLFCVFLYIIGLMFFSYLFGRLKFHENEIWIASIAWPIIIPLSILLIGPVLLASYFSDLGRKHREKK